jgi:hypothetical protein
MAGQLEPIATHACPGERNVEPWWQLRGWREHESECLELGFNLHGRILLAGVCQRWAPANWLARGLNHCFSIVAEIIVLV